MAAFNPNFKSTLILPGLVILLAMTFTLATPQSTDAAAVAKASWPKTFSLVYCWGTSDYNDIGPWCPCADLTLYRRPRTCDVFDCATGIFYPDAGTWSKTGRWRDVTFHFDGQVTYTGSKQPDGKYRGVMITTTGLMGVWEGELFQ